MGIWDASHFAIVRAVDLLDSVLCCRAPNGERGGTDAVASTGFDLPGLRVGGPTIPRPHLTHNIRGNNRSCANQC